MTEDDLAQVRAALTGEVLSDAIDACMEWEDGTYRPRLSQHEDAMRDVLMAALAPLVRPAPTCATCQHYRDTGHLFGGTWDCGNGKSVGSGPHSKHMEPQSCSLHTPRPSTPEGHV